MAEVATMGKGKKKLPCNIDSTEGSVNIKELLEIHENTIIRFIESNTRSLNGRIDDILKEVAELKRSANFQEAFCKEIVTPIDEKVQYIEQELSKVKNEFNSSMKCIGDNRVTARISQDLADLKEKMNDMENRNRRNNVRVVGLAEHEKESWSDTEEKVKELIKTKLELDADTMVIERAHRVGKRETDRPRVIVARFLNWKDKEQVMKNAKKLKSSGIFINEDYSTETVRRRKELYPVMMKIRSQGHFATMKMDKLVVHDQNEKTEEDANTEE